MNKFLWSVAFGIALAAIAFAGYYFANYAYDYIQASMSNNTLRRIADVGTGDSILQTVGLGKAGDEGGQTAESIAAAQKRVIDFTALKKINPEIVAWLYIPNSRIDYPIAQAKDNDYYLHHDFYRRSSFSGCVFLDKDYPADFSGHDSPVYGHHMRNKSMFGSLDYFRQASFRDSHQIAFVYLPDKTIKYQFVQGQLLTGTTLPLSTFDFKTLTMVTCEYDHPGDHYMVREKFLTSRAPGESDPNDPVLPAPAKN
ncbi:MAG: class B sortase [Coriobacteriia bacterium]|nr:class B sortase [Coriobacteriia bacterium]